MVGVGDVEVGMRERDHIVAEPCRVADDCSPEHPAAAEDEQPHRVIWKRKLRSCAV